MDKRGVWTPRHSKVVKGGHKQRLAVNKKGIRQDEKLFSDKLFCVGHVGSNTRGAGFTQPPSK